MELMLQPYNMYALEYIYHHYNSIPEHILCISPLTITILKAISIKMGLSMEWIKIKNGPQRIIKLNNDMLEHIFCIAKPYMLRSC